MNLETNRFDEEDAAVIILRESLCPEVPFMCAEQLEAWVSRELWGWNQSDWRQDLGETLTSLMSLHSSVVSLFMRLPAALLQTSDGALKKPWVAA